MAGKKTAAQMQRPDLKFDMPEGYQADGTKIAAPDVNAQMEALKAQIAGLTSRLETADKTNLALMTQAPSIAPALKPTEVDLKGLPDPVTNAEEYGRELLARQRVALQNEAHNAAVQQNDQNSQIGKLTALWEDFKEANPLYSDESKIRYIANEIATKARSRGRDINKYMYGATDMFFSDVTKLYDKTFGQPKPAGAVAEEDDEQGSMLEADDIRTQGIPGGGPSKVGAVETDPDKLAQGKSMFSGLKDWQLKTGFTI